MDRWTKTQFKLKISDYIPAKWVFLSMLRLSWVSREADRPGCQSWGMMAASRHRRSRVRREAWGTATDSQLGQRQSADTSCQCIARNNDIDKHILWSLKIVLGNYQSSEIFLADRDTIMPEDCHSKHPQFSVPKNESRRRWQDQEPSQQLQGRKTALLQPFPWEWHQEEQEGTRLEYLDKNNFLPKIISKRSAVGLPGDLIETWSGWRRTTSTRTSMSTSK